MMASSRVASGEKQSNLRTKHITTACLTCRRKKIKCSGETPTCSHCILYSQTCVYQHGTDKRKVPVKERLAALEAHAYELEELLKSHGITAPNFERGTVTGTGISVKYAGDPDFAVHSSENDDYSGVRDTSQSQPSAGLATPRRPASGYATPTSDTDPLMEQLSGRIGSLQIAEDGQLRFYGATSNLHIIQNGPLTRSRHSMDESLESLFMAAGVGQFVDSELEDHLLKIYFCWEDPSIHCVNEIVFWRERAKCKATGCASNLYSEFLTNVMCAVSASMTSRQCPSLPQPLPEFFAARAKALLNVEMVAPTISTVQSFVILSAVEALLCRDASGWLFSGMAVRLAVDLGLHLDLQSYVDAGVIDHEEAVIRSTVFWGAFVHDRMWSVYVGRPVALEDKHITLAPPMDDFEPLEQHSWVPYLDESKNNDNPSLPNPIEQMTRCNVSLCAKMCRIRESLYADKKSSPQHYEETQRFAVSMRAELEEWLSSLPATLRVDYADSETSVYLPHVLQLHMQYYTVMILVNRPFFSAPKGAKITPSNVFACRSSCTVAAANLVKLVRIYRRLYTLQCINVQSVHLVFTAGLIHVYNACGSSNSTIRDVAMNDLEICCEALNEMSHQFKNALRAKEVITHIKDELLRHSRSKRQKKSVDTSHAEKSTKRPRLMEATFSDTRIDGMPDSTAPSNYTATDPGIECGIWTDDIFALDSLFWAEFTNIDLLHAQPT